MAGGAQGDGEAYGRAADPVVGAAGHLAVVIGVEVWSQAREQVVGLLSGGEGSAGGRFGAWVAEALRRERAVGKSNAYLVGSLAQWQREIAVALADGFERVEEARRFAGTVRSLLPRPDETAAQVAVAAGHGTVNAVRKSSICYQVVLGFAPRPRGLSRGTVIAVLAAGGMAVVAGGVAVARHVAVEAVGKAGVGHLPQAPLADPAVVSYAVALAGGAMAPGITAAARTGTTILGKAASAVSGRIAGVLGVGTFGVGVPTVAAVVVAVTAVTVVVTRVSGHGVCGAAVQGQSSRAVLADAAGRVELTGFRFDITRGPHHVPGAVDPQSRNVWFTRGLADGPMVAGTITQGKVVLPVGVTTPCVGGLGGDRGPVLGRAPDTGGGGSRSFDVAARAGCDLDGGGLGRGEDLPPAHRRHRHLGQRGGAARTCGWSEGRDPVVRHFGLTRRGYLGLPAARRVDGPTGCVRDRYSDGAWAHPGCGGFGGRGGVLQQSQHQRLDLHGQLPGLCQ